MPPYIIFVPLFYLSLINAMNIVIVCKGNKERILSWLRTVTNGRSFTTNSVTAGICNWPLSSRVRKL